MLGGLRALCYPVSLLTLSGGAQLLAGHMHSTLVVSWKGLKTCTIWERASQPLELILSFSSPCRKVMEEMKSCVALFCSAECTIMV